LVEISQTTEYPERGTFVQPFVDHRHVVLERLDSDTHAQGRSTDVLVEHVFPYHLPLTGCEKLPWTVIRLF
jgi:hypothetical protein